jgi:hypothetical protein
MTQMRRYFQRLPWKKDLQLSNLFEIILLKGHSALLAVLIFTNQNHEYLTIGWCKKDFRSSIEGS